MQNDKSEDGTVIFLPNRLNCQPVVVRGLTADELWISVGVTGATGLVLGIGLAVLTGQIGMVPTMMLAEHCRRHFCRWWHDQTAKAGSPADLAVSPDPVAGPVPLSCACALYRCGGPD